MDGDAPARGRPAAHPYSRRHGRRQGKGKPRGKQPKLSPKQQTQLRRMHGTGEYSINDLAELFSIGKATV